MTGQEIIDFIKEHHLENYDFVVSHEIGEGAYSVYDLYIDEDKHEVEVC